ncbi:FAD-dependent oxidoreductase [Thioclava sp. F36-6]|uniref:flavin monoamine oxidase family protein n=1 Tax=Thioclava sp. F36-6 TaxID=1915316 RepID=UPI000998E229|nr:FAD-dependent oxidoreductase [Thioclava sp. F36-6]OOY32809.1 amine oxidase [Thioclava sp. F36-6]
MKTQVAIVGGGLAGLALARDLHARGVSFELFEARPRFGGRIKALETATGSVDLGPSWFWPGQPRIAALTEALNLRKFEQFARGAVSLEDASGEVHRNMGFASMAGSWRLEGGMVALTNALAAALPTAQLHPGSPVVEIGAGPSVTLEDGRVCEAEHVVLAVPPRVAAHMSFAPQLSEAQMQALRAIPTWMAGHAKFVALYERPFWREAGLSGDAMSQRGPLAEIHDASGPDGTPAALFGFLGVPARARIGQEEVVKAAALEQLGRIFGPEAANPQTYALEDWAVAPETATGADLEPLRFHPDYGLPPVLRGLREGRVHFASSETAPEMGGYMEGALAAAERVAHDLVGGFAATP